MKSLLIIFTLAFAAISMLALAETKTNNQRAPALAPAPVRQAGYASIQSPAPYPRAYASINAPAPGPAQAWQEGYAPPPFRYAYALCSGRQHY